MHILDRTASACTSDKKQTSSWHVLQQSLQSRTSGRSFLKRILHKNLESFFLSGFPSSFTAIGKSGIFLITEGVVCAFPCTCPPFRVFAFPLMAKKLHKIIALLHELVSTHQERLMKNWMLPKTTKANSIWSIYPIKHYVSTRIDIRHTWPF